MTNIQNFKRDRPTIGVLAGWSSLAGARSYQYRALVVNGIQSAARNRGCHLLLSWGIRQLTEINRTFYAWPQVSAESDFIPVGQWNTDGLIVFRPISSEIQLPYLQQLMAKGFPVLFIGSGDNGPGISVNNHMGIHQAMAHLVEHGHRRIAFLAGLPTDQGDSGARLDAYHSAVTKHGLDADPALVVWGWHDFTEGNKAMRELLQAGIKFTAVVTSNDNSAVGAMHAIREAGLKIPDDIAIIGFDNEPGAIAQVPPLTSVHVPLNLIGEQALLLMVDHLTGLAPLESVEFSPRLLRRQSCGCTPNIVSLTTNESLSKRTPALQSAKPGLREIQQQLVNEMMTALPSELRFPGGEQIQKICNFLVEAFYAGLKQDNPIPFQTAFIEYVEELEIADANIDFWQEMISILRREMRQLPVSWRGGTLQLAEDMLHDARAVLGESAQRRDMRHEYQRGQNARALSTVTARLSIALTNAQVIELLNTYLPGIGIGHARVVFFEAENEDPVAWSVVPGLLEDGSLDKRFRTREFPPFELYASDELLNVILLPLVFQGEVLGYAAFDASDLGSCAVIARQLAVTIKVSRLHAQVVELSLTDPLTGLHNRRYLDLFLTNEIARGHRFSHALSIIMLDIDHFKDYNDQFGHLAGDQALRQVAGCLKEGRRTTDVIARIGGEEFAIILPETDINGALICAEKLRASVAAISNLQRPVTISLGIAVLNKDIYKPETLLQQADEALYEAKKTGRNRICIYQKE